MSPDSKQAQALLALAAKHGGQLKPEIVVEAARNPRSPLHKAFTWDDTLAAQQHRLWQARMLIRVAVTYLPHKGEMVKVRAFTSLTPDRKPEGIGYRTTVTVLSDDEMREQLLADAREDMRRFKAKYRMLSELAEVFEAMNRAAA